MTFDEQLAALGKNPAYVLQGLKKIFPQNEASDTDHDAEIMMRLGTAWRRPASWEFDTLIKARFKQNSWLGSWFQSYVGGISDPDNLLTSQWVKSNLQYCYEAMKTPEAARVLAEAALGLRVKTNREHFGSFGYDLSKMDPAWLDQPCKY